MKPPPPVVAPVEVQIDVGSTTVPMLNFEELPPLVEPPEPRAQTRDDWPHTTRVLPWMLAGFIAVLWLVPFNTISMRASGPIDLHLDRLILPFILATWLVTMA